MSKLPQPHRLFTVAFSTNLAVAMASSTFVSFAIGSLAVLLREDLGISRAQVGLLASAYLTTGGLFSTILGSRVGILGSRVGLITLYLYTIVGFVIVAAAPTYTLLIVAVAVAGVAGAVSNPLTNHAIAEHALPGARGVMVGIKQSGVQVGILLSGAVLPTLGVWAGWRIAMLSAAVMPLVGIALTLVLVPRAHKDPGVRPPPPARLIAFAREHPFLLWLSLYAMLVGGAMSATGVYLPLYAFDELGLSVQVAGLVGSLIGLIGIPALILWGRAVEHRGHRLSTDLLLVAVGSTLMGLLVLAAATIGWWALVVGAVGFGAISSSWNVIAMMAAIRDLPPGTSGAGTGIIQVGFYLGLLGGPVVFGAALGDAGHYTTAWTIVAAGFACAALTILAWRAFDRRARTRAVDTVVRR